MHVCAVRKQGMYHLKHPLGPPAVRGKQRMPKSAVALLNELHVVLLHSPMQHIPSPAFRCRYVCAMV